MAFLDPTQLRAAFVQMHQLLERETQGRRENDLESRVMQCSSSIFKQITEADPVEKTFLQEKAREIIRCGQQENITVLLIQNKKIWEDTSTKTFMTALRQIEIYDLDDECFEQFARANDWEKVTEHANRGAYAGRAMLNEQPVLLAMARDKEKGAHYLRSLQNHVVEGYRDVQGRTILHYAAQTNDVGLAEHCKNCRVDLNAKDKNGLSALHLAIQNQAWDLAAWLVSQSAQVEFNEVVLNSLKSNEAPKSLFENILGSKGEFSILATLKEEAKTLFLQKLGEEAKDRVDQKFENK